MEFELNPPSCHSDSYVDIQFMVEIPYESEITRLTFINTEINKPIDIIGVSNGYVQNNTCIFKKSKKYSGFINLFHNDKMNKSLKDFNSITIQCNAEIERNGQTITETKQATFFNESNSIDSGVVPFGFTLIKNNIDISSHEDIEFSIYSSYEKSYEICLKTEDLNYWCCFKVLTKAGTTNIKVPFDMVYSDLELSKTHDQKFKFYYIKTEGITYSRFMNRKFIPIMNSNISFYNNKFEPLRTDRQGPAGKLSEEFILSDRYLVHTHKDFSSFKIRNEYPKFKMINLSMFWAETQDMDINKNTIKAFGVNTEKIKTFSMPSEPDKLIQSEKYKLLGVYSKKFSNTSPSVSVNTKEKGCAPCGRKK